jgi:hypothetical protein
MTPGPASTAITKIAWAKARPSLVGVTGVLSGGGGETLTNALSCGKHCQPPSRARHKVPLYVTPPTAIQLSPAGAPQQGSEAAPVSVAHHYVVIVVAALIYVQYSWCLREASDGRCTQVAVMRRWLLQCALAGLPLRQNPYLPLPPPNPQNPHCRPSL